MKLRGFTLTEILITIGIIGVLISLAVPVTSRIKRASQRASCLSTLRGLGVGLEGYLNDHNGVLPDLAMGRARKSDPLAVMETELLPYFNDDEMVFRCPADHEHFERTGSSYFWNENLSGMRRHQLSFMGAEDNIQVIPLIFDKEAFHGDEKGVNFLYADQSTSNQVQFDTGSRY